MDYAERVNLRSNEGRRPVRGKYKHTSRRVEEKVVAQNCLCGKTIEPRIYTGGECKLCREKRGTYEEDVRELSKCYTKRFDTTSGKMIVIRGSG